MTTDGQVPGWLADAVDEVTQQRIDSAQQAAADAEEARRLAEQQQNGNQR